MRWPWVTTGHREVNSKMGHWWLYAGYDNTFYNHVTVPNSSIPDCGTEMGGLVTSRSWHRGGVNVSMADGQSRFVDEDVDLRVWRALGTRAGGEVF